MEVMWNAPEPITGRTCQDRLDHKASGGKKLPARPSWGSWPALRRKQLLDRVATDGRDGHPREPGWAYEPRVSREEHLAAVIRATLACAPDPAAVLALAGPPPGSRD